MSDGFEARKLLREARQGVLATAAGGEPQQGLVTPATDAGCDILLLLSGLSAHTRALQEAPACAVLVMGRPTGANPQMTPRVSVNGHAERLASGSADRQAARARYLAVHPYASLYVDFEDFSFWRVRSETALHVAGFGRARKLDGNSLRPAPGSVASLDAARPSLLAEARRLGDVAGLDGDGIDLLEGEATVRRSFDASASDPDGWRAALLRLVTSA